jgi:hypothetical protein
VSPEKVLGLGKSCQEERLKGGRSGGVDNHASNQTMTWPVINISMVDLVPYEAHEAGRVWDSAVQIERTLSAGRAPACAQTGSGYEISAILEYFPHLIMKTGKFCHNQAFRCKPAN